MMLLLLKSEADCLASQQWQITHARGVAHAAPLNAQRTTANTKGLPGASAVDAEAPTLESRSSTKHQPEKIMSETQAPIARVGVDLAKQVIQVHAVDAHGRRVQARALKRELFFAWCERLPAGCLVAMEACSSAHYWARRLRALGLDVRLIAAHFVAPYRMEGRDGKNDAADAAAICEAASRPSMRFVPIKTCEQQGVMCLHRVREGLKEERTACINRIRGVLMEFGLAFGKSPKVLRGVLADVIEDASNELSSTARLVMQRAFDHWRELDEHMRWCDRQVGLHVRSNPSAQRAAKVIGIGELSASALTAGVGDFKQFKSGHQFGAWLGIVPRQHSSGSTIRLGRITKRGDDYLRTLLIQGAKSAVMTADRRDDPNSKWLVQLTARVGWQKACIAMANKNARILWAVMTREEGFDPHHVSVKPGSKQAVRPLSQDLPDVACAG
jgi:transposase